MLVGDWSWRLLGEPRYIILSFTNQSTVSCLRRLWFLCIVGLFIYFFMQNGVFIGGRQHQQITANARKGHLCLIRTSADQEESLHTVQRLCPYVVRERCACAQFLYLYLFVCQQSQ